jgi:hypothetical protein
METLTYNSNKKDLMMWTGFIWLRIGSSGSCNDRINELWENSAGNFLINSSRKAMHPEGYLTTITVSK